ncbi:MAG: hypothetical protein M1819_000312 [Sarea resinae]|nr:MAG: hypothetical protein M1819_000312 [Sarea resinae]
MATTYRLPTISTVSTLSTVERATILDHLFEPIELLRSQSFSSYDDLIASIGIQLTELLDSPSTSDADWLVKILGAHPRLGEKKVDSAQSKAEQARLNSENESETEELRKLNDEYEQRFLGLRYV